MRRIPELDALRGLATLAIIFYHLWFINISILGTAVDLFFVLSGYLITSIILANAGAPRFLRTFYARRFLRIWPIYYLTLLLLILFNSLSKAPNSTDGLLLHVFYLQRLPLYWSSHEPSFLPAFQHTWTLAIEEQFYLLWPLAIVLCGRRGVVPLSLGVIIASVASRASGLAPWLLLSHGDGLALGGLLAASLQHSAGELLQNRRHGIRFALLMFAATVALVASELVGRNLSAGALDRLASSLRLLFINLVYCGLVGFAVSASGRRELSWLRAPLLRELGAISYGLYLYHHIVFHYLSDITVPGGRFGSFCFDFMKIIICIALAIASWRLVERPILELKKRFRYSDEERTSVGIDRFGQPIPLNPAT